MAIPTSTAHLTCLCGAVHEPGTLLSATELPIEDAICHCNLCRHTSGSLGPSFPRLGSAPSAKSLNACTQYTTSATHAYYFCGTCGTPTFVEVKSKGYWCCFAGTIERDPEQVKEGETWTKDIVKIARHDWLDDTGDGGMAAILLKLGGRNVPCFHQGTSTARDQSEISAEDVRAMAKNTEDWAVPGMDKSMVVKCRCEGTDLRVRRANFKEDQQGCNERFSEGGDRYVAMFCACRSCRLQSGVNLQPWTYIPPRNFLVAGTGKEVVFGKGTEGANESTTLKHYWSSEGCCRSFCGKGGASFFYWCDDRPEVVDLSVGVIRGKGAMAREWVEWKYGVSHKEECVDNEITEAVLEKGSEWKTGKPY